MSTHSITQASVHMRSSSTLPQGTLIRLQHGGESLFLGADPRTHSQQTA